MNCVKELLRFQDLKDEVFETNKTLVITHSDMDGTKCAELLKEEFPKAKYFYVDAKIETAISTPPSKGDPLETLYETRAKLVIIADISDVYFWVEAILDKVRKNPELRVVIFDHHYLLRIRKSRKSPPVEAYEHYVSPSGQDIRGAYCTLIKHQRISFYWKHASFAHPLVKKWLKGELEHVLKPIKPTIVYVSRLTDERVSKADRVEHVVKQLKLSKKDAKKLYERIRKKGEAELDSFFFRAKVELVD